MHNASEIVLHRSETSFVHLEYTIGLVSLSVMQVRNKAIRESPTLSPHMK